MPPTRLPLARSDSRWSRWPPPDCHPPALGPIESADLRVGTHRVWCSAFDRWAFCLVTALGSSSAARKTADSMRNGGKPPRLSERQRGGTAPDPEMQADGVRGGRSRATNPAEAHFTPGPRSRDGRGRPKCGSNVFVVAGVVPRTSSRRNSHPSQRTRCGRVSKSVDPMWTRRGACLAGADVADLVPGDAPAASATRRGCLTPRSNLAFRGGPKDEGSRLAEADPTGAARRWLRRRRRRAGRWARPT
jgi:hypothetical protein